YRSVNSSGEPFDELLTLSPSPVAVASRIYDASAVTQSFSVTSNRFLRQITDGIGEWHAANCPGRTSRIPGSSSAQRSWAFGQRVRKRQPDGGAKGDGTSPASAGPANAFSGSVNGTESRSARVYGCAGSS